jgi:hypothetical protein
MWLKQDRRIKSCWILYRYWKLTKQKCKILVIFNQIQNPKGGEGMCSEKKHWKFSQRRNWGPGKEGHWKPHLGADAGKRVQALLWRPAPCGQRGGFCFPSRSHSKKWGHHGPQLGSRPSQDRGSQGTAGCHLRAFCRVTMDVRFRGDSAQRPQPQRSPSHAFTRLLSYRDGNTPNPDSCPGKGSAWLTFNS